MKRIKTKDIDTTKLITKSEYARLNKISPSAVQKQIDSGKLAVIVAKGVELIHL